jgi:DNA-binding winged helix-turn-helix (wHTH) protein
MRSGALNEQPFVFGGWRVEPPRGVLSALAGGAEIHLEPRLMDLLLQFAGSAGRVLSKAEIIDGVWGGRAFGDDTLAAAISRLHKALGETPQHRYIKILLKRGYRLVLADGAGAMGEARAGSAHPERAAASQVQARLYFEAAVREGPGWAPAHVGLAETVAAQQLPATEAAGPTSWRRSRPRPTLSSASTPTWPRPWSLLGQVVLLADRSSRRPVMR